MLPNFTIQRQRRWAPTKLEWSLSSTENVNAAVPICWRWLLCVCIHTPIYAYIYIGYKVLAGPCTRAEYEVMFSFAKIATNAERLLKNIMGTLNCISLSKPSNVFCCIEIVTVYIHMYVCVVFQVFSVNKTFLYRLLSMSKLVCYFLSLIVTLGVIRVF